MGFQLVAHKAASTPIVYYYRDDSFPMPELEWSIAKKRATYPKSDILRSKHGPAKTYFQMQTDSHQRPDRRLRPTCNVVLPVLFVLSQLLVPFHIGHHAHDDSEKDSPQRCTICLHGDRLDGPPPIPLLLASPTEPADKRHPAGNLRRPPFPAQLRPPATGPPA